MATIDQTNRNDDGVGGFIGFLRDSFHTGLSAAENIHQTAMEVPLDILQGAGFPEEKTTMLKDKHRDLLRGMYGSIDSICARVAEGGAEQAALLTAMIRDRAQESAEKKTKQQKVPKKEQLEQEAGDEG